MTTAVSCYNLNKNFYVVDNIYNWKIVFRDPLTSPKSIPILSDIDIEVPKGHFIGILGKNGAGKSTLLRILGHVYPPSQGIVTINGPYTSLFEMGAVGNRMLTGYTYADRFLELSNIKKKQRKKLINHIKDFSELDGFFYKPLYTYSSGMLSRLYFATATELEYSIYFIDELLSVGDERFQMKCWRRLKERFKKGASGVLVTHDWSATLKLCDRAYILEKGKFIYRGPALEAVKQYLKLPLPSRQNAEIIPLYEIYKLKSGDDCSIKFIINLSRKMSIGINYTIERYEPGEGWEIILLNEKFLDVQGNKGENLINISIKKLPVGGGDYFLNIFLKSNLDEVPNDSLDFKSWTYGNGIPLFIDGQTSSGLINLPWKQSIVKVEK